MEIIMLSDYTRRIAMHSLPAQTARCDVAGVRCLTAVLLAGLVGGPAFAAEKTRAPSSNASAAPSIESMLPQERPYDEPPMPRALGSSDFGANAWQYDSHVDQMTGKSFPLARLDSVNSLNLSFPYAGRNHGHLIVRASDGGAVDVMFSIDRGQTMCPSWEYGCVVTIRFDAKPPIRFSGIGPADQSTELAFLSNPKKFIAEAKKAKTIKVGMVLYNSGLQVLEFAPATPLQWPPKR